MSRRTRYTELKAELKQLAHTIRSTRREYKNQQREGNHHKYIPLCWELVGLSREFRHKHIAYCLLNGTPMERIEVKTNNPPDQERIKEAMEHYGQDVCASSSGSH